MITLNKLQSEVAAWSRKQFPRRRAHQPLLEAQAKLGELAAEYALMEVGEKGNAESHRNVMEDAVAQCLIALVDFCERNDMDMGESVSHCWSKVKMRNWTPDEGPSPDPVNS